MSFIRAFAASFSIPGLILGIGLFCVSLTPSLLPRAFTVQGVLSGLVFATGYGIGKAGYWFWKFMELKDVPGNLSRIVNRILGSAMILTAVITLSRLKVWQNSIRLRMEMTPVDYAYPLGVLLVAVFTALAIILSMRLLLSIGKKAVAFVNRFLPRRISIVLGGMLFTLLLASFVDRILLKASLHAVDKSFAAIDRLMDDAYDPPRNENASGSEKSIIAWSDIGRNGKRFISDGPTKEEIAAVLGRDALQPIRVYAGYESGETLQERARNALAELKRVGGFDRSVLIIATSTGTGWLDPSAVDSVEFIHAGNTAIVTLQYSYLPSWLTLMVAPEVAKESARALFKEIYGYWTELPDGNRPALYLHGLSLGALGSEFSSELITIIADPINGALWSGPPFSSAIWREVTRGRVPGSEQWQPVFRDSTAIRFLTQDGFPHQADSAEWGPLRIVYLQHASDPMSWFSFHLAFERPGWLGRNRGPDVSPYFRWFPLVTFFQVAFDLPAATSVPLGYGHNFAPNSYIDAWIEVTQPKNWSVLDTEKLKAHFVGFNPRPL